MGRVRVWNELQDSLSSTSTSISRTHVTPLICPVARARNRLPVLYEHAANGDFVVVEGFLGLWARKRGTGGA